jgi:hypothetical protein
MPTEEITEVIRKRYTKCADNIIKKIKLLEKIKLNKAL